MRRTILIVIAVFACLSLGAAAWGQTGPAPRATSAGLHVDISQDFISALFNGENETTETSRDVIVGVRQTMRSKTTVKVRAELVPHATVPLFDLVADGRVCAVAEGCQMPFYIDTESTTLFTARKRFWLRREGVYAAPALACAKATIRFVGARMPDRDPAPHCLQCLVYDYFLADLSMAQWEVARKTEERTAEEIENKIVPALRDFNVAFTNRFKLYRDMGIELHDLDGPTTSERVVLRATLGPRGPDTLPPAWPKPPYFGVRVHESTLAYVFNSLLAGKTMPGELLDSELVRMLFSPESPPLKGKGTSRIVFAKDKAVAAKIDKKGVHLELRVTEITLDKTRYVNLKVNASFRLATVLGVTILGFVPEDIVISPLDPKDSLTVTKELRTFVEERLNGVYDRLWPLDLLKFDGALAKAGSLRMTHLDTADGWLLLGWKKEETK